MKNVVICIVVILTLFCGCKKEKKINGIICRKGGGSYWIPIANFCVNCKEYQLGKHCGHCGIEQSLVIGKSKCVKCGNLSFARGASKYCRSCGGIQEIVLVTR